MCECACVFEYALLPLFPKPLVPSQSMSFFLRSRFCCRCCCCCNYFFVFLLWNFITFMFPLLMFHFRFSHTLTNANTLESICNVKWIFIYNIIVFLSLALSSSFYFVSFFTLFNFILLETLFIFFPSSCRALYCNSFVLFCSFFSTFSYFFLRPFGCFDGFSTLLMLMSLLLLLWVVTYHIDIHWMIFQCYRRICFLAEMNPS